MKIKTTIAALSNPALGLVLQKINGAQVNTRLAYRFKKICDEWNKNMNRMREEYKQTVALPHGELDDKKNLVLDASKPWGFKLKEGVIQADFDKANEEFHKKELLLDQPPLLLSELLEVKLSAADLTALGDFLADPEKSEENVVPMVPRS